MVFVGTAEIEGEIQELERGLEEMRSRLDEDTSSF